MFQEARVIRENAPMLRALIVAIILVAAPAIPVFVLAAQIVA
jgi:hypothetical protein